MNLVKIRQLMREEAREISSACFSDTILDHWINDALKMLYHQLDWGEEYMSCFYDLPKMTITVAIAPTDLTATLSSVTDLKPGYWLSFHNGTATIHRKITAINRATKVVTLEYPLGYTFTIAATVVYVRGVLIPNFLYLNQVDFITTGVTNETHSCLPRDAWRRYQVSYLNIGLGTPAMYFVSPPEYGVITTGVAKAGSTPNNVLFTTSVIAQDDEFNYLYALNTTRNVMSLITDTVLSTQSISLENSIYTDDTTTPAGDNISIIRFNPVIMFSATPSITTTGVLNHLRIEMVRPPTKRCSVLNPIPSIGDEWDQALVLYCLFRHFLRDDQYDKAKAYFELFKAEMNSMNSISASKTGYLGRIEVEKLIGS